MRRQYKTTGDYGIGNMIHFVHMTDDVHKLNDFYARVFGGYRYMGIDELNYLPPEDRWASLVMVADTCIETMAPNFPIDVNKPVGKFYTKFGQHLHSVGYKVDDLAGLADRLLEKGIYIGAPGGGKIEKLDPETVYFYPSPRDTAGLMVELCKTDMRNDPKDQDTYTELMRLYEQHPMTFDRFAYVTLGVKDLDSAVATYVDVMQAVPIQDGIDEDLQCKYMTLQLGDCLLQLAQPLEMDSDLGRHVEKWGNCIYSLRWKVLDLNSAEAWLNKQGVRTTRLRENLVYCNVDDTHGAPMFFTTEEIAGDPFAK
ncbi:MAG: hypothetical protein F2806_03175 [Actinobacteria bacterium]|uniref:Unannotated protein n=2 Tax=freshwater metagenome TaxID=449393 RepID=A0A6J7FN66_9ZZZZ|nr:hypothetical protein [Actinomycetota bacterium]